MKYKDPNNNIASNSKIDGINSAFELNENTYFETALVIDQEQSFKLNKEILSTESLKAFENRLEKLDAYMQDFNMKFVIKEPKSIANQDIILYKNPEKTEANMDDNTFNDLQKGICSSAPRKNINISKKLFREATFHNQNTEKSNDEDHSETLKKLQLPQDKGSSEKKTLEENKNFSVTNFNLNTFRTDNVNFDTFETDNTDREGEDKLRAEMMDLSEKNNYLHEVVREQKKVICQLEFDIENVSRTKKNNQSMASFKHLNKDSLNVSSYGKVNYDKNDSIERLSKGYLRDSYGGVPLYNKNLYIHEPKNTVEKLGISEHDTRYLNSKSTQNKHSNSATISPNIKAQLFYQNNYLNSARKSEAYTPRENQHSSTNEKLDMCFGVNTVVVKTDYKCDPVKDSSEFNKSKKSIENISIPDFSNFNDLPQNVQAKFIEDLKSICYSNNINIIDKDEKYKQSENKFNQNDHQKSPHKRNKTVGAFTFAKNTEQKNLFENINLDASKVDFKSVDNVVIEKPNLINDRYYYKEENLSHSKRTYQSSDKFGSFKIKSSKGNSTNGADSKAEKEVTPNDYLQNECLNKFFENLEESICTDVHSPKKDQNQMLKKESPYQVSKQKIRTSFQNDSENEENSLQNSSVHEIFDKKEIKKIQRSPNTPPLDKKYSVSPKKVDRRVPMIHGLPHNVGDSYKKKSMPNSGRICDTKKKYNEGVKSENCSLIRQASHNDEIKVDDAENDNTIQRQTNRFNNNFEEDWSPFNGSNIQSMDNANDKISFQDVSHIMNKLKSVEHTNADLKVEIEVLKNENNNAKMSLESHRSLHSDNDGKFKTYKLLLKNKENELEKSNMLIKNLEEKLEGVIENSKLKETIFQTKQQNQNYELEKLREENSKWNKKHQKLLDKTKKELFSEYDNQSLSDIGDIITNLKDNHEMEIRSMKKSYEHMLEKLQSQLSKSLHEQEELKRKLVDLEDSYHVQNKGKTLLMEQLKKEKLASQELLCFYENNTNDKNYMRTVKDCQCKDLVQTLTRNKNESILTCNTVEENCVNNNSEYILKLENLVKESVELTNKVFVKQINQYLLLCRVISGKMQNRLKVGGGEMRVSYNKFYLSMSQFMNMSDQIYHKFKIGNPEKSSLDTSVIEFSNQFDKNTNNIVDQFEAILGKISNAVGYGIISSTISKITSPRTKK